MRQMLMHYGENYVRHKFDDPKLLASWSQHAPYRLVILRYAVDHLVQPI